MSPHDKEIYSIGHSNRPIEDFIKLLRDNHVQCLADIRRFPNSRRNPQFNKTDLANHLKSVGMAYHWLGEKLGGFRDKDYAHHMNSDDFKSGLQQLQTLAEEDTTAFMCAEKRFSDCHRRFIADALVRGGWRVLHIVDPEQAYSHNPSLL